MLVTTRSGCSVCGRETRHYTYPLFDKRECLRCGSVGDTMPLVTPVPWAMNVGFNEYHWFDLSDFVPYAGIPRTP